MRTQRIYLVDVNERVEHRNEFHCVQRGFGMRATREERAEEHVKLTIAMTGDDVPETGTDDFKASTAYYLADVIADLLALARQYGMDLTGLLNEAINLESDEL